MCTHTDRGTKFRARSTSHRPKVSSCSQQKVINGKKPIKGGGGRMLSEIKFRRALARTFHFLKELRAGGILIES